MASIFRDPLYLCYLLLGAGTLLPWNAFITAADLYAERYPGYHVDRLITIFYLPVNLIVLLAFIHNHERVQQKLRIVGGFAAFTIAVLAMPFIDLFPPGIGTLSAMLLLVSTCGAADGAAQGALFGEAASLDGRYTQALVAGTAISGVAASVLRILTKGLLPDTSIGLRISADLYFLLAAATCAACLLVHAWVLPRLSGSTARDPNVAVVYNNRDDEELEWLDSTTSTTSIGSAEERRNHKQHKFGPSDSETATLTDAEGASLVHFEQITDTRPLSYISVASKVAYLIAALVGVYGVTLSIFPGVLAEDVMSEKLGSWYPVVLMTVFNAADCLGKWLPAVSKLQLQCDKTVAACAALRVMFIPAFHLAATRGAGGYVVGLLAALLGMSNGYLTAAAMMLGPRLVEPRAAALCGNIMVLSLIVGLCIGAACGFLWLL